MSGKQGSKARKVQDGDATALLGVQDLCENPKIKNQPPDPKDSRSTTTKKNKETSMSKETKQKKFFHCCNCNSSTNSKRNT